MLDRIDAARREEALAVSERLDARAKLDPAELLRERRRVQGRYASDANDENAAPTSAKKRRERESERREKDAAARLWVDAHAPKTFTELLSPENVNREVLHWLKAWDGVVFKRAPPKAARDVRFGGRGGGPAGRPRRGSLARGPRRTRRALRREREPARWSEHARPP